MSSHESYIFFLCLAVFVMLVAVFSFLITLLVRAQLKLTRAGLDDEDIVKERQEASKKCTACIVIEKILSGLLFVVLSALLIFSIYINSTDNAKAKEIPTLKVVKSTSMSVKRESNEYLFENNLNDQIQMFDIIRVHPVPAEEELELYNIVVYETSDKAQIVHRIVGIQEPNEKHPDSRYFLLQGDAVKNPDVFPVLYSQIKGIYYGERTPNIGSFIMFMQSPAGWLCILLVFAFLICEPLVFGILKKEQDKRYALLYPPEPEKEETDKPYDAADGTCDEHEGGQDEKSDQ